ncbi:MAG: hypothetical protein ACNA8W_12765, partial [Bradymonadaceae bacterium]
MASTGHGGKEAATMRNWCGTTLFAVALICLSLGEVSVASAESAPATEKPLITRPPDAGYGSKDIGPNARFPTIGPREARVDRRGELNPLADRNILWPTAHTPEAGTRVYSNYLLLGNQISYATSDDLILSLGIVLPYENTYGQASAKWVFHRSRDLNIAMIPFGVLRAGTREYASTDIGAGLGLVADITPHDNLVLSAGLTGYGTIYYRYNEFDSSQCRNRTDFIERTCIDATPASTTFPKGGHWLAAHVGMTYYVLDWLFLNTELMYGGATGSFLGTETALGARVDHDEEVSRYLEGEVGAGIPFRAGLTPGFGMTLAYRNVAAQ